MKSFVRRHRRALQDGLFLLTFMIVATAIAYQYDIFENSPGVAPQQNLIELDEALALAALFCVGLLLLCWRLLLSQRRELDPELPNKPPLISDSYSEFLNGAYKVMTLGCRYYRPIGPDPVPSSSAAMRENINETIDASVFGRWRADDAYRPQNLVEWGARSI